MRKEVVYLLQNGLKKLSFSLWSSPCLLVLKPDRLFRNVNAVTVPDSYPLPHVEDCKDYISSACFVSKLDVLKGYWQVLLTLRPSEISAFMTPDITQYYTILWLSVCEMCRTH